MTIDEPPAVVGGLKCQQNSFLKKFTSEVVSCELDTDNSNDSNSGKKGKKQAEKKKTKYAVQLNDTILFPEGGGQPSDQGYIIDLKGKRHFVEFIRRDKLKAIHLLDEPLTVGESVEIEIDWKRRLDHMQQHTGQHLLSAILDKYEIPTLSWSMGELINYIEIPKSLSDEEVEQFSDEVNERIQDSIDIHVEIPEEKDSVKQDKIPDDYDVDKGILRVIKIGELDENPCCGTHLNSTGQILSIALLHQTSVRGTNSRLHFLAGDRVRKYAANSHKILKQSSSDLSCQPEEIVDKISNLNLNYKKTYKQMVNWKEVNAKSEGNKLINEFETIEKKVYYLHNANADLSYISLVLKNVTDKLPKEKVLVLIAGEGKEGGSVIVNSSDATLSGDIAKQLQTKLSGLKGGGKNKWQGKVVAFNIGELEEAIELLQTIQS